MPAWPAPEAATLRFIVLATALLLVPLASAHPILGTDCADRGLAAATDGCVAYAYVYEADPPLFGGCAVGRSTWDGAGSSSASCAAFQGRRGVVAGCGGGNRADASSASGACAAGAPESAGGGKVHSFAWDAQQDLGRSAAYNVTAADVNGDGRPDLAQRCGFNGTASDPNAGCGDELAVEGGDLDGDGAGDASLAKNGTYRPGRPVYGNLAFEGKAAGRSAGWQGACAADDRRASASCAWDGPAGWGSVAHEGLPPTHSNLVLADLDGDGAVDLAVFEQGGSVVAFASPAGCAVYVAAKPGGLPGMRTCSV